jgi:hypothetical protein
MIYITHVNTSSFVRITRIHGNSKSTVSLLSSVDTTEPFFLKCRLILVQTRHSRLNSVVPICSYKVQYPSERFLHELELICVVYSLEILVSFMWVKARKYICAHNSTDIDRQV